MSLHIFSKNSFRTGRISTTDTMNSFSTYSFPEAKSIVVCGDIHGEFNAVIYKLCIQYQMTDTVLIIAGDCGFGFDKPGYYDNV